MTRGITFVGMDVHKASINVAVLEHGKSDHIEWKLDNRATLIEKLARRFKRDYGDDVVACYEAGPCGFALMRQLVGLGVKCQVIAPALIPQQAGNKVKTDKRDARKLALLFRAGLLTEVHPPTADQEAVRDLCRARDDARDDNMRSRHRLSKFLLRHGISYDGQAWTRLHRQWLGTLKFEHAAAQATLEEYLRAVDGVEERIKTLDAKILETAGTDAYREAVGILCCFRGIDVTGAMVILSELGDITRFESPRKLMAYLGITPSEYSSGGKEKRGGITKTGNAFVRRILVEAAWHYRHAPRVGKKLRKRRDAQPAWAIAIADKCQSRLYRRHRHLTSTGKTTTKANVAVAREMSGFIWAALVARRQQAKAKATK